MTIRFTNHAIQRQVERLISDIDIAEAIKMGQWYKRTDGKHNVCKGSIIVVTEMISKNNWVVITAFHRDRNFAKCC